MEEIKEETDTLDESEKLRVLEPVTKSLLDIKEYQVSVLEPVPETAVDEECQVGVPETVTMTVLDIIDYQVLPDSRNCR